MSSVGSKTSGASSVPARNPSTSGIIWSLVNSCDPQFGQKPRWMVFPLSALDSKYLTVPSIRTLSAWTKIPGVYALPELRWQSRQWQLPENTGSAEVSKRTARHRQPPVSDLFMFFFLVNVLFCNYIRMYDRSLQTAEGINQVHKSAPRASSDQRRRWRQPLARLQARQRVASRTGPPAGRIESRKRPMATTCGLIPKVILRTVMPSARA